MTIYEDIISEINSKIYITNEIKMRFSVELISVFNSVVGFMIMHNLKTI